MYLMFNRETPNRLFGDDVPNRTEGGGCFLIHTQMDWMVILLVPFGWMCACRLA